MKASKQLFLALLVTVATLAAQNPTFTGVVNAASGIPPGLPNSGIAQGALFDVYGTNLGVAPPGGSAFTEASLPLPTTAGLAGTTITITVNGTTVSAPILFTLPTQVGAVMPSNTPLGAGTLTLTYNGKSASTPVTVVQSAFGISNIYIQFANNGVGMGEQAAVTFGNNPVQAAVNTHSAAPGDQMIIWGTGLGATTVAGDSQGAPFGNVGSVPLVFVGGVQSPSVAYWGRSPGQVALDQINFTIPQNVPVGCNVSVIVETMNGTTPVVSNGPTISIASTDGAACSDPTAPFPLSLFSKTSAKIFYLGVQQQVNVTPAANGTATTTTATLAGGNFFSVNQSQIATFSSNLLQGANYQPSYGSCYTGFSSNPSANGSLQSTPLDAGTITLAPPSGTPLTLTDPTTGSYSSVAGTTALPGGTWTFSNGAGGPGVGPLKFTFQVPQPITWNNQSAIYSASIDRTKPLTVTWTGGDTNGYVDIQVSSHAGTYYVGLECAAPTSGGQFIIPSSVLLSLPAGAAAQSYITVSTNAIPSSLGTVSGFDLAEDASTFQTGVPVIFK